MTETSSTVELTRYRAQWTDIAGTAPDCHVFVDAVNDHYACLVAAEALGLTEHYKPKGKRYSDELRGRQDAWMLIVTPVTHLKAGLRG